MAFEKVGSGLWFFKKKLQFQFKKNRTYIIPTSFGLIFAALVLIFLMMALGYANNLLYIFVFFLISVWISGMFATNRNIDHIQVNFSKALPCFLDEESTLIIKLKNTSAQASYNLDLKTGSEAVKVSILDGHQEKDIEISWRPACRGIQKVSRIRLESTFPFGLLKSWKVIPQEHTALVYPSRKKNLEFPNTGLQHQNLGEAGLFRNLREFQNTDSALRIDWRATAKHQRFLVKNFETKTDKTWSFKWSDTEELRSLEARVSQLTAWVDQAEKMGISYSLEVGSLATEPSQGSAHLHRCLKYLALFNSETTD
jgi:uncharacterized protein (DUF58 family)